MISRTLPIAMASSVAMASLAPSRRVLLSGERVHSLLMQVTARIALEGKRVLFLCGDNQFDPYAIARFARSKGARPEDLLRSILIARAFTVYQLVELVRRLPRGPGGDPVIISGLCSTFFDEDVPLADAARLFYRVLWQISELARSGVITLIAQSATAPVARRKYFLADLCRASDIVLQMSGEHTFTLERRRTAVYQGIGLHRLIDD